MTAAAPSSDTRLQQNTAQHEEANAEARNATRGGLVVLLAKLVFIVGGLAQKILLPRVIGMEGFGAFGRMSALPNILNNVTVSATIMGVSKAVASSPDPKATQRQALRVHALIALALGASLFLAAPFIADFQRAPGMTTGLRVMSGVLAAYGLYAACVGVLNGTRRFVAQAGFDITYTGLRTALMLGGAWLAMRASVRGEVGAALGIVAASSLILIASYALVGRGSATQTGVSDRSYLMTLLPVAGVQLVANLLMQVDIILLGRVLTPEGATPEQTAGVNLWCGYYQAAQVFAFLPYQLSFAVTQVLLPSVARAYANKDVELTRTQVLRGVRWGLLLVGLLSGTIVFLNGNAVSLLFGREAGGATRDVVRWLCVAQGLFAMLAVGQTVLVAVDRRKEALTVSLITLAAVGFGFLSLGGTHLAATTGSMLEMFSVPPQQLLLVQVSQRMAAAMALGALCSAFVVAKYVPKSLPLATVARVAGWVLLAAAAGAAMGTLGKIATIAAAAAAAAAYVVFLIVSREFGPGELAGMTKLLKRR